MEQNYLDNLVGVLGHPAAENPGVVIQEAAFADMGFKLWRFLTIDVDPDALEDAIKGLKAFKMKGINCTIPHKIKVLEYLDDISETAKLIGAVNMIVNNDGKLYGENTDGKGFMMSLKTSDIDSKGKKIVVLGAGGASRAICVELALTGAKHITVVNRPEDRSLAESLMKVLKDLEAESVYTEWHDKYNVPEGTDILVNATPIGLYPNVDELPNINYDTITKDMFVQDVIPNPAVTPFLREAEKRGAKWQTGVGMLINQASINIEMWTGEKPNKEVMLAAYQKAVGC